MTGNAKVRRGGKPGGRSGQVATHAQHDDISGGQQVDKMIIKNRHHHQFLFIIIINIVFVFRYKALNVMMDVEGRPRVVHTVSSYIDYSKDKQGFTQVLVFNFRDKQV